MSTRSMAYEQKVSRKTSGSLQDARLKEVLLLSVGSRRSLGKGYSSSALLQEGEGEKTY